MSEKIRPVLSKGFMKDLKHGFQMFMEKMVSRSHNGRHYSRKMTITHTRSTPYHIRKLRWHKKGHLLNEISGKYTSHDWLFFSLWFFIIILYSISIITCISTSVNHYCVTSITSLPNKSSLLLTTCINRYQQITIFTSHMAFSMESSKFITLIIQRKVTLYYSSSEEGKEMFQIFRGLMYNCFLCLQVFLSWDIWL